MNRAQRFNGAAECAKSLRVGRIVGVDVDAVADECRRKEAVAVDPQLPIVTNAADLARGGEAREAGARPQDIRM